MTSVAAYVSDGMPERVATGAGEAGNATRYLRLPEGTIAYDDRGSGPLVIMVPSLGDLRQEYRFLAAPVLAAGYRVVTVDLRGHGGSSAGWPEYTAAAVGADLLGLLRHLDAGPAVLVGTSLGAGAAVWAAAEAPDLVRGLVLIGPFVRDVPASSALRGLFQRLVIWTLFAGPWAPAAWSAYYGSLYRSRVPADLRQYRTALAANLREPGRLRALKAMMWASKADIEARHPDVAAPTLVVMGSRDPDFSNPAAEAELVAARLRGSAVMIEGAGHYPHAEMPAETAPHILSFIDRVGGR